jgi:hypothetical protein
LSAEGAGCLLALTHVFTTGGEMADFASGWHWHLDMLERVLAGGSVAPDRPRLAALSQAYRATL